MSVDRFGLIGINLANKSNNVIGFRGLDVNKTYDQLTVSTYEYLVNAKSTVINDKITLTR